MPKCRVKRHSVTQPFTESFRLIPLTQGQNAIVDAEDFEYLSQWNWQAHWDSTVQGFRVKRKVRGAVIFMHRQLSPGSPQVDHRNGNGLDNRRKNLRPCTPSQNQWNQERRSQNTSGYKGVSWAKRKCRWHAEIWFMRKHIHIGMFATAEDAARAYDQKAKELHGEFARLNFPQ